MKSATRIAALSTATALFAAPLTWAVMAPANADIDRQGVCSTGDYELSVDRERRGYEIDANIDNVAPGSRWTLTIRHNGARVTQVTRVADNEGEVEVGTFVRNRAGRDKIAFSARNGSITCGTTVRVA